MGRVILDRWQHRFCEYLCQQAVWEEWQVAPTDKHQITDDSRPLLSPHLEHVEILEVQEEVRGRGSLLEVLVFMAMRRAPVISTMVGQGERISGFGVTWARV